MRTSNMPHNFAKLFVCAILFLPNIIKSMPPHRLHLESSPSYTFACFIALCIGAMIFGIIHKYCMQPISPVEKFLEKDEDIKKLLESLNKPNTSALTLEQKEMINKLRKQKASK